MAQTPRKKWTALNGKNYSGRTDGKLNPPENGDVEVFEVAKSVNIPPNDPDIDAPYGMPVSATLGINLVADFLTLLKEASPDQLNAILQRSCAITLDKNVLLKTLSQPDCEGVRLYFCAKSTGPKEDQQYLSLVTVGVDSDGKDLLYEYTPIENKQDIFLTNKSLLSEYGHPPGGPPYGLTTGKTMPEIFDKATYPLLAYAMDISGSK